MNTETRRFNQVFSDPRSSASIGGLFLSPPAEPLPTIILKTLSTLNFLDGGL